VIEGSASGVQKVFQRDYTKLRDLLVVDRNLIFPQPCIPTAFQRMLLKEGSYRITEDKGSYRITEDRGGTVSPKTLYRGLPLPITPAQRGPCHTPHFKGIS
jgi:hypothetical protein